MLMQALNKNLKTVPQEETRYRGELLKQTSPDSRDPSY